jgi:hypothetical protein
MVHAVGLQPRPAGWIVYRSVAFLMDEVVLGEVFLGQYRSTDATFFLVHVSLTFRCCNN